MPRFWNIAIVFCLLATPAISVVQERDVDANNLVERSVSTVCGQIGKSISKASSVYYPDLGFDTNYKNDIAHWATTSTQDSVCSVEPGSPADVAQIIRILGATRTPFAVKGSGHIMNPGFSSTTGVTIAMSRFNQTIYDASTHTATVGAGLIWDDVYEALQPYNVSVVGGRVSGVGVAGFILGGGYSWFTSQRGLSIDNVVGFNFVKPNGSILLVTASSDAELFFSLKGGYNNFGIVTSFVLKTYTQGPVWGGSVTVATSSVPAMNAATAAFSANTKDPKAAVIVTYNAVVGTTIATALMFYDGPNPPAAIFKDFLALDALLSDVSTQSLLSLVQGTPAGIGAGFGGRFNTVPLQALSLSLMNQISNQTSYYSNLLSTGILSGGILVSYDVEPFLSTILTHAAEGSSAYPATRTTKAVLPLNLYFSWLSGAKDASFLKAIKDSTALLTAQAKKEGQDLSNPAVYPNYANADTPVTTLYGSANLARMKAVKKRVDPNSVMDLAGGFKV